MHTGSDLLETWVPDGGFMIERRKLKTGEGGSAVADAAIHQKGGPENFWQCWNMLGYTRYYNTYLLTSEIFRVLERQAESD